MDDLISRQAAIDALKNRWKKTRNYEGIGDDIAEECELYLKQVPHAQPEPHEGHWIDKGWNGDWAWQIDGRGNCWRVIECSECGKSVLVESNYCPNRGAKMEVEHDRA